MVDATGFAAPFDECADMQRARRSLEKLAKASLPVVIAGESGTGRSTLAEAVAQVRAGKGLNVVTMSGLDGLTMVPSADTVLVVRHLDELNQADQRRLADFAARARQLIGTAGPGASFQSDLATVVDAGIVSLLPLRDRGDDSLAWARWFLSRADGTHGALPPGVEQAVRLHRWSGNLHELRQRVERAVALSDGGILTPADLGLAETEVETAITPLEEAVASFRREYVAKVLERCGGNRSQAARVLKVDARTVFRFLESERQGAKGHRRYHR